MILKKLIKWTKEENQLGNELSREEINGYLSAMDTIEKKEININKEKLELLGVNYILKREKTSALYKQLCIVIWRELVTVIYNHLDDLLEGE